MQKDKSRKKRILITGIVAMLIVAFLVVIFTTTGLNVERYAIFSSVNDFQQIIDTHEFEQLTPSTDRHIGNINYIENASFRFRRSGRIYQIFAYTFYCYQGALDYFYNVTGVNRNIHRFSQMSSSSNVFFRSNIVLRSGNKAFLVFGQDVWNFNSLLRIIFDELEVPIPDMRTGWN